MDFLKHLLMCLKQVKDMAMQVETLVQRSGSWDEMRAQFRWPNPARYNIAEQICERWARAEPNRHALTYMDADGGLQDFTYQNLSRLSSQLANSMQARGVVRGDRSAVLLPQTPETILAHLAAYKLGAIAVPLFTLFGEDGLQYRLSNAGAKVVVTDHANLSKILNIRDQLPDLQHIYCIDGVEADVLDFWAELDRASDHIEVADTTLTDPAFISYTSGTTGPPKGALHGHKVLLGHLPGVETHHNFLPQKGDCMWTPADWAWLGGLTNVMMPALNFGVPLVAHRMSKFDPERAFWLMRELNVKNTFLPPTALKMMRQVKNVEPLNMRSVGSGGESLGTELQDWGQQVFGVAMNEFYGQTECNLVVGNSAEAFEPRPGSIGKPVPGHEVAIVDEDGNVLPAGEVGEIAVLRPDMSMFLGYWNNPEKTAEKFVGDWMLTGDIGRMDDDGYYHFSSRTDDVITSAGYRIGPSEIEDCLVGHPSVLMAGVIGKPDAVRTEIVKAYIVLNGEGSEDLKAELVARVRARISPHVAPREIEFIDELPMTATGKILRRELKNRG
ncbi:MAG: acyl-CoA synthetase [Paracoccaceae bacterium]